MMKKVYSDSNFYFFSISFANRYFKDINSDSIKLYFKQYNI